MNKIQSNKKLKNVDENQGAQLVVYNDNENTFDWVINSLIEVLDYSPNQAEQCTYLIHYKGKYGVKTGKRDDLMPFCLSLCERNLKAKIE